MTDPRKILSNGRIADAALNGVVEAERYGVTEPKSVNRWNLDICRAPDGPRDRQLVFGDLFDVLEDRDSWSFGRSRKDGYVGYVDTAGLSNPTVPTHYVSNIATHAYAAADMKSGDLQSFPFGASLTVHSANEKFYETSHGFIPHQHLKSLGTKFTNMAEVARMFLGTPYLWGGNSPAGIDCSGLTQAACLACGQDCPGDSDQQQAFFTQPAIAPGPNQLYFWKGHVALTLDKKTLIHANAHTMSVAIEEIEVAIKRIAQAGDGPVTHHAQL